MILETATYSVGMMFFVLITCALIFTIPAIVATVLTLRGWRVEDEAAGIPHHHRPLAEVIHFRKPGHAA